MSHRLLRTKSSPWLLAAALLSAVWLSPTTSHACSCIAGTVEQGLESAAAVFEGVVTDVTQIEAAGGMPAMNVASFKLVRVWKGEQNVETLQVRTATDSARCGVNFEKNVSYLVFAYEENDALAVSLCSRTQRTADAGEDLAFLGAGITPVSVEKSAGPEANADEGSDNPSTEASDVPSAAGKGSGGCASCSAAGTPPPSALLGGLVLWWGVRPRRRRD